MPVLAISDDGAINFANSAFAEMVGRTVDQMVASTFQDLTELLWVDEL